MPAPHRVAPSVPLDSGAYLGDSPPPVPAPAWKRRLYVDRPADLAALANALESAHVLAIDAEFSQVIRRQPGEPPHRLALLQLVFDNNRAASYVVDTQKLADLSPLQAALARPDLLKLFHSVGSDARVLATRGLVAHHTLDLEAVSRSIFGQRESGLQSMLQRACGLRLDKSLQRADWSRRPLTPAMVAYAARDAEMTLVLYDWLRTHYPWSVAMHEVPAAEPPLELAAWILPYLEGARPRQVSLAVADAGLAGNPRAQEHDLRQALAAVRRPAQRARVMRLIIDLDLQRLAPQVRPYLGSEAAEERAGAIRVLSRLRAKDLPAVIEPATRDAVFDVRQAAYLALENRGTVRRESPAAVRWSSEGADGGNAMAATEWQARLRARFGVDAPAGDGE